MREDTGSWIDLSLAIKKQIVPVIGGQSVNHPPLSLKKIEKGNRED